jgi:hypothetical protein
VLKEKVIERERRKLNPLNDDFYKLTDDELLKRAGYNT